LNTIQKDKFSLSHLSNTMMTINTIQIYKNITLLFFYYKMQIPSLLASHLIVRFYNTSCMCLLMQIALGIMTKNVSIIECKPLHFWHHFKTILHSRCSKTTFSLPIIFITFKKMNETTNLGWKMHKYSWNMHIIH